MNGYMNTNLNEKTMIDKTKEEGFEKGTLNYIDAVFALFHFIITISPLILIQSNIVLSIIGITCACLLLVLGVRAFYSGELSYTFYGTALMVCNWLYLIPLVIFIPFIAVFLIFEIPYLISLWLKTSPLSAATGLFYRNRRRIQPQWTPHIKNLRKEMQTEQAEKQLNIRNHLFISALLLITLLVIFMIWYDPHFGLDITIP